MCLIRVEQQALILNNHHCVGGKTWKELNDTAESAQSKSPEEYFHSVKNSECQAAVATMLQWLPIVLF